MVEHVDVAQVQVLVLQDGAQLLEDVAPGGRGGGIGSIPGIGGEGAVVALEVALLLPEIGNGERMRQEGYSSTHQDGGGHFEVKSGKEIFESKWSRRRSSERSEGARRTGTRKMAAERTPEQHGTWCGGWTGLAGTPVEPKVLRCNTHGRHGEATITRHITRKMD